MKHFDKAIRLHPLTSTLPSTPLAPVTHIADAHASSGRGIRPHTSAADMEKPILEYTTDHFHVTITARGLASYEATNRRILYRLWTISGGRAMPDDEPA